MQQVDGASAIFYNSMSNENIQLINVHVHIIKNIYFYKEVKKKKIIVIIIIIIITNKLFK